VAAAGEHVARGVPVLGGVHLEERPNTSSLRVDSSEATSLDVIRSHATSLHEIAHMRRLYAKELPQCDNLRDSLRFGFTGAAMRDPQLIKLSVVMARGGFESGTHSLSSSARWFRQDVL
jgi:hypothetical protein